MTEAFRRHSRPQPSVFGAVRNRPNLRKGHNELYIKKKERNDLPTVTETTFVDIVQRNPWVTLRPLGELRRGSLQFTLCVKRENKADMVMMKRDFRKNINSELEVLQSLSHPNIVELVQAFVHQDELFLGFRYIPFTLEDLLHVSESFEEPEVAVVSSSVGPAENC